MDDLAQFEQSIQAALTAAGCDSYGVSDLLRDTRETRDEIYADLRSKGTDVGEPFVNFVIISGVAIFTVFCETFAVYVVQCNEAELVTATDSIALADVDAFLALLACRFNKPTPDAILSRVTGEVWLG